MKWWAVFLREQVRTLMPRAQTATEEEESNTERFLRQHGNVVRTSSMNDHDEHDHEFDGGAVVVWASSVVVVMSLGQID